MSSNDNNTCEKRILIHPDTDLSVAIAAAMSFYKEHILAKETPTGVYHSQKYVSGESNVEVYHSSTSVIVRNAEPKKEEKSKDALAEMVPEEMPTNENI